MHRAVNNSLVTFIKTYESFPTISYWMLGNFLALFWEKDLILLSWHRKLHKHLWRLYTQSSLIFKKHRREILGRVYGWSEVVALWLLCIPSTEGNLYRLQSTCNTYQLGEGVYWIFKLIYLYFEMDNNNTRLYLSQHVPTYCSFTYYNSIVYS